VLVEYLCGELSEEATEWLERMVSFGYPIFFDAMDITRLSRYLSNMEVYALVSETIQRFQLIETLSRQVINEAFALRAQIYRFERNDVSMYNCLVAIRSKLDDLVLFHSEAELSLIAKYAGNFHIFAHDSPRKLCEKNAKMNNHKNMLRDR
jgi:hypothetical protein